MGSDDDYRLIRAFMSSLSEGAALLAAEPGLLEARVGVGETPLHYLAIEDQIDAVRFLHEHGADLEAPNEFGETALRMCLRLGNRGVADYLLDQGADVHDRQRGETMLHEAACGGDVTLIRRVIAMGVPVSERSNLRETALSQAIFSGSLDAVRGLLEAGIDVNAHWDFDRTALSDAARKGRADIVELLLASGADPTLCDCLGHSPADEAEHEGHSELAARLSEAARSHHTGPRQPPGDLVIRPLAPDDREWVARVLAECWGSTRIVSRGHLHEAAALPGLAAFTSGDGIGLLTYRIEAGAMEVVTLDVARRQRGIGRALLSTAERIAIGAGCSRIWLVTTNDNARAQAFYAALGWTLVATHVGAVTQARALKPEIPERGYRNVPIEDELEYERLLASPAMPTEGGC
jgi:ankyrin repeat protein/GNAT superfamily N-acetyltransferase